METLKQRSSHATQVRQVVYSGDRIHLVLRERLIAGKNNHSQNVIFFFFSSEYENYLDV